MANLTQAQIDILNNLKKFEPALKKTGAASDIALGTSIAALEATTVKVALATYNFAVNGGAIGTIDLGVTIPINAIILDGMVDVLTTVTTAGADAGTLAIQANAANDIVTAIAVSDVSNPWGAGLQAIKPLDTAATAVKTTAARNIKVVIGGQAVTAGKFNVVLRYVVSA